MKKIESGRFKRSLNALIKKEGYSGAAKTAGVTSKTIHNWETGKHAPRVKNAFEVVYKPLYQEVKDLEDFHPKGKEFAAKGTVGVDPRSFRHWKQYYETKGLKGRSATTEHLVRVRHAFEAKERFIGLVEKNYNLTREEAIKEAQKEYLKNDKKHPEMTESDKWINPYPERGG